MSAPTDVLTIISRHANGMRNAAGTTTGAHLTPEACGNFADELERMGSVMAKVLLTAQVVTLNARRTDPHAYYHEVSRGDMSALISAIAAAVGNP